MTISFIAAHSGQSTRSPEVAATDNGHRAYGHMTRSGGVPRRRQAPRRAHAAQRTSPTPPAQHGHESLSQGIRVPRSPGGEPNRALSDGGDRLTLIGTNQSPYVEKRPQVRVIPVLLPVVGCEPALPAFPRGTQYVDLRKGGLDDREPTRRLFAPVLGDQAYF